MNKFTRIFGAIVCFVGIIFVITIGTIGCTANSRVRNFGGTETVNLEANKKLVNITWKDGNHLWILTRPMNNVDTAETYEFAEKSSWGVMQGKVIVVETKGAK